MSFSIVIHQIPDKDLGPVLARLHLPRGATHEVIHKPDYTALIEGPKNKSSTANGATKLMMTGKTPSKQGALIKAALTIFEKLEVKKGIGNVSVDTFRSSLADRNMHFRLINEGYLGYLK